MAYLNRFSTLLCRLALEFATEPLSSALAQLGYWAFYDPEVSLALCTTESLPARIQEENLKSTQRVARNVWQFGLLLKFKLSGSSYPSFCMRSQSAVLVGVRPQRNLVNLVEATKQCIFTLCRMIA